MPLVSDGRDPPPTTTHINHGFIFFRVGEFFRLQLGHRGPALAAVVPDFMPQVVVPADQADRMTEFRGRGPSQISAAVSKDHRQNPGLGQKGHAEGKGRVWAAAQDESEDGEAAGEWQGDEKPDGRSGSTQFRKACGVTAPVGAAEHGESAITNPATT